MWSSSIGETRKVLYKDMKEMFRAKSRFAFSAYAKDGGKIKRGEREATHFFIQSLL